MYRKILFTNSFKWKPVMALVTEKYILNYFFFRRNDSLLGTEVVKNPRPN